jgi:transcriptional regulator with GAF, ATPase, and Fis domain
MATPAQDIANLVTELQKEGISTSNADKLAAEISKAFNVKLDEVAILRLVGQNLVFLYPSKLHQVGSIPMNTTNSVAARTASAKRAEIINNFAQTKHTSVFEAVDLDNKARPAGSKVDRSAQIIQKLMSVPIMGSGGVLGVIQVCRKGPSGPAAGADFSPPDLQKLVSFAGSLAPCFK